MKTIGHHFQAIGWTIQQFSKGKFLLYFLPGLVIALFFWYVGSWARGLSEGAANESWYDQFWVGTSSVLDFIFKQIAVFFILTLLSPINTFLSEGVDAELTGMRVGLDLMRFINDFIRMIFVVLIAIILEFFFMGAWWIFSKIFNLEFLNSTVFFLSASFFYGFSFYDYSLERYEIGLGGSYRFSKKYFLPILTTGVLFMALYYIPIVGVAIAPVVATVISTHVFLKSTGKLDQINQQKETKSA